MSTNQPAPLTLSTENGQLRVEFFWSEDRFAHRLYVGDVEVARSLEGDGGDPWPPSPPLQQLSLEEIDGAAVILGVGAAGRCHWSVSVELDRDQETPAVKFDFACQCKETPGFLGSRYRMSLELTIHCNRDDSLAINESTVESAVESTVESTVEGVNEGEFESRVVTVTAGGEGQTRRWSYRLQ